MVSGVGVRWGEPARDAEAMGAPSTCRRPDASALSTDWGEGRRGQDQTEGEVGEVAKAEAEGRRVQSGVVKRRQEQDRQEAMKGAGRRRFGLAHEALSPRPHPPRREDQFHGPEPCSLWGEDEGDWSDGHGHGAAEPDQWRGLQVGASRPARARQSKAVSVSEPCWAGLAVCVTAWGPGSPVPLLLRLPATYRTTRSPDVRADDFGIPSVTSSPRRRRSIRHFVACPRVCPRRGFGSCIWTK
jgi:hypothetical protein